MAESGGGSGIRTHGTLSRTHAFQACALSRSAIPPAAALPAGTYTAALAVQAPKTRPDYPLGAAKRPIWNGASGVLVVPVAISSAITSPTPGPSWKPWPQKPKA